MPTEKKTKLSPNQHTEQSNQPPNNNNDGDLKFMFSTMLPAASLPALPPITAVDKTAMHTIRADFHECICLGKPIRKYPKNGFADGISRDIVIPSKASGKNQGQVRISIIKKV